jgi:hypothetical protein
MEMREAKVVQRAVAIEPLLHHLSALPNHLLVFTLILTTVIQCHLVAARRKHPCERSLKLHRRDANSVIWPSQSPLINHPRRRVSLIQSLQTTHITTHPHPTHITSWPKVQLFPPPARALGVLSSRYYRDVYCVSFLT